MQAFFFVRLSGPEHSLSAAASALGEAGFEVSRLSGRGDPPAEVWLTAECHAESFSAIDELAAARMARDVRSAVRGHGFTVREYGTAEESSLRGSERMYRADDPRPGPEGPHPSD